MTSELPRPSPRNRPDAAFRQQALGVAADGNDPAAGQIPARPDRREIFRQALSRIPDRDPRDGAAGPAPTVGPPLAPAARSVPAEGNAADPAADPAVRSRRRQRPTSTPPRAALWRRVVFGTALLALIASIPVLAGNGYDLVTGSTDGKVGKSGARPEDPGYEELVISTPTAVLVHTDAEGTLVGLTFLALGAESGGGTVIFLPLGTKFPATGLGIDSLRLGYTVGPADPDAAASQVSSLVGDLLNVGIDEVIELDQQGWANAVAPVAPFAIDNLDSLDLDGIALPAGPAELGADLVGPYLTELHDGESELGRLARQEQVWGGWLQAVAASGRQDAVPGESGSGLGLFARTLAAGPVTYAMLPVTQVAGDPGTPDRYQPDEAQLKALVVDAVPAPDAAGLGSRRSVRLLNGLVAGAVPGDLIRKVAALDGSVVVVGNGPSFGRDKTTIVYADPNQKSYALLLKGALGATGSVKLDREAPDSVDVTVVFGRDLLGDVAITATSATLPTGGT